MAEQENLQIAELTEEIQVNEGLIDECKKKLGDMLYEKLGQLSDEQLSEGGDVSFDYTGDAALAAAKIRKLAGECDGKNQEIEKLRNIVRCPKCGNPARKEDLFCSCCGTRIIRKQDPEKTAEEGLCPQCGAKIEADAVFCVKCGYKVKEADINNDATILAQPPVHSDENIPFVDPDIMAKAERPVQPMHEDMQVQPVQPVKSAVNICPKCGNPVDDDSVFCIFCGTRVR